jgi:hypothetical protein
MYRLKITGTSDKAAARINKITDPQEKASEVLVILYKVFPASIAKVEINKYIYKYLMGEF